MLIKLFIIVICLNISSLAQAQDIKLDADKRVEYHQKEQKLVAIGNATASKENMSIKADTLIGYYSPTAKNKISRIEAIKSVTMTSDQTQAFGDSMIYDVSSDTATLKGKPAKIKTPDAQITSDGDIVFYQSEQKAIAKNNVKAIDHQGNLVNSDEMIAYFKKDENNKLILDYIDINDIIKIKTQDADITAKRGTYYANEGKIKLFEDVTITQKGNILRGNMAETDLNTGISKILSGKTNRVSGIFKETKKTKEK